MAAKFGMPFITERLVDVDKFGIMRPTPVYFRLWQQLSEAAAAGGVSPADFSALLLYLGSPDGTLGSLPPFPPPGSGSGAVIGQGSIETAGTLPGVVLVSLLADVDFPDPTTYYGADSSANRGWFRIADALTAQPEITLTIGPDNVTDVSITPVVDSGIGALLAITVNGLGQVIGTRAATTDDLTEGATNLYFTDARAVNALETTGPDYLQLLLDEYNP